VAHRREARFREQIQRLEDKVTTLSSTSNAEDKTTENSLFSIRNMHKTIQDNITLIQSKTTQILKDQERDLLRAFKSRMTDVNDELNRERRKNESGSSEWVQRCHKLTEELEWMKDMTYRLEEQNKSVRHHMI
jgi:endo-alpha-1,4-polygalactosaminidase (GH114 family)